jgi:hypothetical protein
METIAIKSRIIVAAQYDRDQQHLSLEFKNGEHRLFSGVPRRVVMRMARAESPGNYYIANVRARFAQIYT